MTGIGRAARLESKSGEKNQKLRDRGASDHPAREHVASSDENIRTMSGACAGWGNHLPCSQETTVHVILWQNQSAHRLSLPKMAPLQSDARSDLA